MPNKDLNIILQYLNPTRNGILRNPHRTRSRRCEEVLLMYVILVPFGVCDLRRNEHMERETYFVLVLLVGNVRYILRGNRLLYFVENKHVCSKFQ